MRVRAAASTLIAGVVLTLLAGCGLVTPVATQVPYSPGDGVQSTVGDVELINVILIADGESADGNLMFSAHNGSNDEVQLTIQYEADSGQVTLSSELPSRAVTNFGYGDGGQFVLPNINVTPGDLFDVFFQYGNEEGVLLTVPVLDDSLPYYTEHLPQPAPVDEAPVADEAEAEAPDETE